MLELQPEHRARFAGGKMHRAHFCLMSRPAAFQSLTRELWAWLPIAVALSIPGLARAQSNEVQPTSGDPKVYACIGSRPQNVPTLQAAPGAPARPAVFESCDAYTHSVPERYAEITTNQDYAAGAGAVMGAPDQFLLVRLGKSENELVQLANKNIIKQVVVLAGDTKITRTDVNTDGSGETIVVPLDDLSTLNNWALVTVQVDFAQKADGTQRQSFTGYFRLHNWYSRYGAFKTGYGFWVPYGLLATNFHRTSDGIPLAAFPVGLAWGMRFYFPRSDFYVGASAMVNWAVYGKTEEQSQTASSSGSSSVTVSSLAFGGIADFGGYVYVGGAYVADLRSNPKNPGPVFVLGVGPALLQILQSEKH